MKKKQAKKTTKPSRTERKPVSLVIFQTYDCVYVVHPDREEQFLRMHPGSSFVRGVATDGYVTVGSQPHVGIAEWD